MKEIFDIQGEERASDDQSSDEEDGNHFKFIFRLSLSLSLSLVFIHILSFSLSLSSAMLNVTSDTSSRSLKVTPPNTRSFGSLFS